MVILIKGLTLPGSLDGVIFYLRPRWSELLDIKVWYAAITQSFYSLCVAMGVIINYASYNPFGHNVHRDALILSGIDTLTSMLAGLTIFSVLGNLASELHVPIEKVRIIVHPNLLKCSYHSMKHTACPSHTYLMNMMLPILGGGQWCRTGIYIIPNSIRKI